MKKLVRTVAFILFCLLFLLAGCTAQDRTDAVQDKTETEKLKVYATIYPVYDFTKKIGGEFIQLAQIIPPGADAHNFEPSAKLLSELTQADLIIYNGANMEPWIPKVITALGNDEGKFVNTSEEIALLEWAGEGEDDNQEETGDHAHEHFGVDPHVWLNPLNAISQSKAIYQALSKKDPAHAVYYQSNYDNLVTELEKLDQEYRETLQNTVHKEFIVAHASFGYLAKEYGLTQIPIRGLTAEGEPSPTKLKQVISLAQEHGLKYIFYEPLLDPQASEVIAEELGVQTLELNPLGNLTEEQIEQGEDYFSVMRQNLANLKIALSGEER